MRSTRSLLAVFAVGALSLSFTACGGDDGELGGGGNASAEDLADAIEEATDGAVSSDDVQDEIDEATGGEGLSDVCIGAGLAGAALFGAMGGEELDDEAKEFFADAQDKVPDEIKDDFAVLTSFYEEYAAFIEDHGGDITSAMSDPEALAELEELNTPEFEEASENVDAWFSENCETSAN